MTDKFNRAMLQLARAARGFTQGDLASRSGVTQALISKLENGITTDPSPETVDSIASALNLPSAFMYSTDKVYGLPPYHYRKRARLGKRALDMIEAIVNIRRMHIERLVKSYEIPASKQFPTIDLDKNQWTPRTAAQFLRGMWLIPRGPIDNLTEIVERAGAIVIQMNFDTALLDAVSLRLPGLPPLIFMNTAVSGDRYRFTLAHEVAHLTCHHQPENDENMEEQADEFAAELLMPAKEIRPYLTNPTMGSLARAKSFWKVSMKALIVQASRLNVIPPSQYTSLNVLYSKAGYSKRGEPFPIPVERPNALGEAIRHHLNALHYSAEEMGRLLVQNVQEFSDTYLERPRLRVVK
jgi:Zn-dependent peptidase ImmA (M78 family)/transcriptional regulator with XRE-family HTH domain